MKIENPQNTTQNIKPLNKNLEVLKKNFPQCFKKDGSFDFDKFKQELSENEIDFYNESHGLDWLGKSYSRVLATDSVNTLIKEDGEFNRKPENKNSQNLLIKGDNLEVLKHLSHAYYEKVKMIYIDPPYNTGKDGFVYQDDRKFTIKELQKLAGVSEEKAKRILDFTQSKSNSHSAWLTFMYPRLYVARQLMRDDGVIFVSIDENEHSQLRLLCDDVFGEENFIESFCWNKRVPKNDKGVGNIHEYILLYTRTSEGKFKFTMRKDGLDEIYNAVSNFKKRGLSTQKSEVEIKKLYKKNGYDRGITLYNSIDENYRLWGKINMSWPNATTFGPRYEVLHPSTGKPVKIPDRGWRWKKDTFNNAANYIKGKYKDIHRLHDGSFMCGKIWFAPDENTQPSSIKYLDEVSSFLLRSVLSFKSNGGMEIENLFQGKNFFSYPKPTKLITTLLDSYHCEKNSIILDFFAGSGTTADAVMRMNSEDGGQRQFILAQLPESLDPKKDKVAYDFIKNELGVKTPTIFDITKERLIRSAQKIQDENTDITNQDLGFKIFETTPIWDDYHFDEDKLHSQITIFDENPLLDVDIQSLLLTWKTYDGSPLTEEYQQINIDGYNGYYVNNKLYLMDKGFITDNLKSLLEKIDSVKAFNPTSVIAFGYNFESKSLREISENIKSYANKKNIDIDFISRY